MMSVTSTLGHTFALSVTHTVYLYHFTSTRQLLQCVCCTTLNTQNTET